MNRKKSITEVTATINDCRKFIANEPIDPIHYVIIKLLIEILDILVHITFIR
jgi:hypothetical protein